MYLLGNYEDAITKAHLSRHPLHVTSAERQLGCDAASGSSGGSNFSLADADGYESSGLEAAAMSVSTSPSSSGGWMKNQTVARAFQILMNAKPVRPEE